MAKENNFIYVLNDKLYVNLTNACTNDCAFCIRSQKDDVKGANMWLDEKPSFQAVISQLESKKNLLKNGITFCGYGEPLLEKDLLIRIAKYIKQLCPDTYIKINTNGHANAVFKKNVLPELKDFIDEISISYNAQNEEIYNIFDNFNENRFLHFCRTTYSPNCTANQEEASFSVLVQ